MPLAPKPNRTSHARGYSRVAGLALVSAIIPLGCGGEQGASSLKGDAGAVSPVDPGSGPTDCSADAAYDFETIEDFETGAATGWYASNETCDDCKLLFADLCETPSMEVQRGRPSADAPCFDVLNGDFDVLDGDNVPITADGGTNTVSSVLQSICVPYCGSSPALGSCNNGNQAGRLGGQPPLQSPFGGPYIGDCKARAPSEIAAVARCLGGCSAALSPRSQDPPNPPDPIPAELIPGGRCNSQFAMHIVAGPFVDWGGTFGRTFGSNPRSGTGWDGVTFWSRVAPGSSRVIRLNVGDEFTDSQHNQDLLNALGAAGNSGVDGGGVDGGDGASLERPHCNPNSGKYDSYTGCDKFGGVATPGPSWQRFFMSFDDMRQAGWGQPQPMFDRASILSMELAFKGPSWDLWIDDIAFYRRRK